MSPTAWSVNLPPSALQVNLQEPKLGEVKAGFNLVGYEPKLIHWSQAETGALETNYNAVFVLNNGIGPS